jgi:hypothetical protein
MRWLGVVGLVLVAAGAGWWLWQIALLEPDEKSTASGYGQLVLAVVGTLSMFAGYLVRRLTPTPLPPVEVRADNLANAMLKQWERAAVERDLTAPLPVRWRRATRGVAVPVAATAAGAFEPLPGSSPTTNEQLAKGTQNDLYDVYAGLPSGRLIITGAAGAGKSTAAILLLLDALRRRAGAGAEDRARMPVPVMFTLHGWDPATTPVKEWLAGKLSEIPGFREGAAELVEGNRIAVFLDGLDEIDEELRPTALRELSRQATFRLVLLSRHEELAGAVKHAPLLGAAAVELRPVDADVAADFLLSHLVSPPPPAWQAVVDRLENDPKSALSRVLENPFTLTLLRDAYDATGPVDELLDRKRFRKANQIEDHLLDRALEAAYTAGPERLPRRYSLRTAQRTLGFVAHQLNRDGSRDLAWWQIPQWTARPMQVFLRSLAVAFVVGIPVGLILGLSYWLAAGRSVASGLPIGILLGYVCAFAVGRKDLTPRRVQKHWWRAPFTGRGLLFHLPAGLGTSLALTLMGSALPGVTGWLTTGLVAWLVLGIGLSFYSTMQKDGSSFDPRQSWRQDSKASLAFAATAGLGAFVAGNGFGMGFDPGVSSVLAIGALGGLAGVAWLWPASTATCPVFCCQVQLALRHRTPLRLMRFLEDARERQLLRAVGPVYQFRHAKLQDRLSTRWADNELKPAR